MCVPACTQKVAQDLSRRGFLRTSAGLAVAAVGMSACAPISATPPVRSNALAGRVSFSRIVDLTHTMTPNFPTYGGEQQLEIENVFKLAENGYNLNRWLLNEHTGTHMDSPYHFSDGITADQIPADDLHGPLAVLDIRSKAEADPDAQLTVEDILAWEASNGPLPDGAIVAMLSGWDAFVSGDKFRNADDQGVMHFPGFHIDAINLLLEERNAKGIFVDTLSLDYGASADFAVHYKWLPANKWGIECVANLGDLPVTGAHVIVGGPKIAGCTGGMTRLFALL